MGWVWRDDDDDNGEISNDIANFNKPNREIDVNEAGRSTRTIVQSNCRTEEVEPGRFVLKCEKTEQVLRDCVGKPTEVVKSYKEYTEEDVTNEMKEGSSSTLGPSDVKTFDFPGFRSDIESIERSMRNDFESMERNFMGGIHRFFEAAEEFGNGFFRILDDPHLFRETPSSSKRQIPIEGHPQKEPHSPNPNSKVYEGVDCLARAEDV